MPLQCNIDSRGKLARLIYGIVLLTAGVLLVILWAWRSDASLPWIVSVAMMLGGAFAMFEAKAGWCIVRAMGIKTRI